MTETPQAPPAAPSEPPPGGGHQDPQSGWNTENLKDYRRLRRSRTDRKLAGVAGGLGRHLNIDPTILRVLFVVLVFFGGAGVLLYGALWLFVPEEGTEDTVIRTSDSMRNALLIAAGVVAGLLAFSDTWSGNDGFPWLVVGGLIVLAVLMTRDRDRTLTSGPPPGPPPGPAAPQGEWAAAPSDSGWAPPPVGPTWTAPPVPPVPNPRRTGPILFGFTLALVALALGVLGLYDVSGGSVGDDAYAALALTVVGAMLVVGAFFGRAGGLIALGVVALVALVVTAVGQPTFRGDRDLVSRPLSATAVSDSYQVPAGRIELDLSEVRDPQSLDGRDIELDANVGEIVVIVPDDLDVTYDADIAYGGAIDTPGVSRDGWGSHLSGELDGRGSGDHPHVDLTIDLQFGHIEVKQR